MTEYTISSVGRVGQDNPEPALMARRGESRPVEKKKDPPVEVKTEESNSQPAAAFSSIRVQFQVDEKTDDVVILIRDSQSDKILRTIPADAIKDLPPGQLMDLFY